MDAERPRCTARTLGGEPCTRRPRPGQTRCGVHDGRQLRRAERKLQRLTVPAVERLKALLGGANDIVVLKAVALILDRTAGPVPRPVVLADQSGVPAVQSGFALGGLIQPPNPIVLPTAEPVERPADAGARESRVTPDPRRTKQGRLGAVLAQNRSPLGRNIEKFRKECGWTFEQLATKVGISKERVNDHINHGAGASSKTLKAYADTFSEELKRAIAVEDLERE